MYFTPVNSRSSTLSLFSESTQFKWIGVAVQINFWWSSHCLPNISHPSEPVDRSGLALRRPLLISLFLSLFSCPMLLLSSSLSLFGEDFHITCSVIIDSPFIFVDPPINHLYVLCMMACKISGVVILANLINPSCAGLLSYRAHWSTRPALRMILTRINVYRNPSPKRR